MSIEDNKALIRKYIQAIDDNTSGDWSIWDQFIAEDFVVHNPPYPGVSLDRDGMKEAAERFRLATPGRHEVIVQVAVNSYTGNEKASRDGGHRHSPRARWQDR